MRSFVPIATLALFGTALAGCSKPAPAPSAEATATETASAAATPAAAASPAAGTYDAVSADGKTKTVITINADGSYSDVVNGGLPVAGLIKVADGKVCFDPSGAKPAVCYTESVHAADGSFTATDDKGATATVRPAAK